jgi:hypothetical protein
MSVFEDLRRPDAPTVQITRPAADACDGVALVWEWSFIHENCRYAGSGTSEGNARMAGDLAYRQLRAR